MLAFVTDRKTRYEEVKPRKQNLQPRLEGYGIY
jgi:hypothetical protein